MKVLIEKHPALRERGGPGELQHRIETILVAEIFDYLFSPPINELVITKLDEQTWSETLVAEDGRR